MKYYCMRYRLNITHSRDNNFATAHAHVFEITVFLEPKVRGFAEFGDIEELMKRTLEPFQNRYLNDFEIFNGDTSVENVGEVAWLLLCEAYDSEGIWEVDRIEISEIPTRTYVITKDDFKQGYM